MTYLNHIESKEIESLSSGELAGLLRKLLYAEAKERMVTIHVPLQITIADGGEDGRWEGDVQATEYIPDRFTIYQVKATELSATECLEAVLTSSGQPNAAIQEVLKVNGCYVFFCGRPYVQLNGIQERINKVSEGLKNLGVRLGRSDQIRFLDSNKIAAWTNRHSSAVAYVVQCCKLHSTIPFRTWKDWSRDSIFKFTFHSNETLDKHLVSLREHLLKRGSIARITGLSGLGKTRLALEALKPSSGSDITPSILSETAVYLDMEFSPKDQLLGFVGNLESSQLSGTVVVDNCPREIHRKLEDIIKRDGCKLSLLTLDYVPESNSPGILHVALEPDTMKGIVPAILKESPEGARLTESQLEHVGRFAHGFPQIATLMAEAGAAVDFATLTHAGIAEKILWGRDVPNQDGRRIMCALSLFTHVGVEGDVTVQKTFIREVLCKSLGCNERDFDEYLQPFLKRRIIQRAGDYLMVTPPPLAVALAAEWWKLATTDEVKAILPEIEKCGLTKFFCNRVHELDFLERASALSADLCGDDGPLSNAEVLNSELGSQLFRAIVDLNPVAATNCIWKLYSATSIEELRRLHAGRRNLVWALEKLCWSKDTFPKASEVLLNFAAAENESWSNNATGQFKQLFQLYLAGTQMPAVDRLSVIEAGLRSNVPEKRRVCVEALGVGLHTHGYMRGGGVEVRGSSLPQQDWEPTTSREVHEYWGKCFDLLKQVICEGSAEWELARRTLGGNLRGLFRRVPLEVFESSFKEVAERLDRFWPEAVDSLQDIFQYDETKYPAEDIEKLKLWLTWITPQKLKERLQLFVSNAPHNYQKQGDGKFINVAGEKAKAFAEEVASENIDLSPHLSSLQSGQQAEAQAFGFRLGERSFQKETFATKCIEALKQIPPSSRNPSLLGSYLRGLSDKNLTVAVLDTVAASKELVDLVVGLTCLMGPTANDLHRVIHLTIAGTLEPNELRRFAYGSVLDSLESEELIAAFTPLIEKCTKARAPVFEVTAMYTLHSKSRWQKSRSFIRSLLLSPHFTSELASSMDAHLWEEAAVQLLNETIDNELAVELTKQIFDSQRVDKIRFEADSYFRPVLAVLLSKYAEQSLPILGAYAVSKDYFYLRNLLRRDSFDEDGIAVLNNLPADVLISWIKDNKEALPRILNLLTLFTVDKEGEYHWHPTVLRLFENDVDEESFHAIHSNMFSYGSTGSRVPYIDKRIRLVKTLENHPKARIREIAQMLLTSLESDRKRTAKEQEQRDAGIY